MYNSQSCETVGFLFDLYNIRHPELGGAKQRGEKRSEKAKVHYIS